MLQNNKLNELLEDLGGGLDYDTNILEDPTVLFHAELPEDNGVEYLDGAWAEGWLDRCSNSE